MDKNWRRPFQTNSAFFPAGRRRAVLTRLPGTRADLRFFRKQSGSLPIPAAKRQNGRLMTEGSTRYGTCCIGDRFVRSRGSLRLGRLRPSSSAVTELRREDVMCNTRGTEPSLDELFGDVAMQLLMRRDGVTESDLRALLSELSDARAVASGGTARKSGTLLSADRWRDQEKNRREPVIGSKPVPPQVHMMTDV